MCSYSYIIEGQDSMYSERLINSTVHGAGRRMGRMEAEGKVRWGNLSRMVVGGDLAHLQEKLAPDQKELFDRFVESGCDEGMDEKVGVVIREGRSLRTRWTMPLRRLVSNLEGQCAREPSLLQGHRSGAGRTRR